MATNDRKIAALEREISEIMDYESRTVFEVLSDKDEMIKNDVYKALLRISLMADATNEACEDAFAKLKKFGITSFSFMDKVKRLRELSQSVASVTLAAKNRVLDDFIVDDDTFVDMCMKHANAHIKRKLKI